MLKTRIYVSSSPWGTELGSMGLLREALREAPFLIRLGEHVKTSPGHTAFDAQNIMQSGQT